jgi:hypothetical protein
VRVFDSACASVLAQINSKAGSPEEAIWLMALPPAPPTPIILITVSGGGFFDSDKEDSV